MLIAMLSLFSVYTYKEGANANKKTFVVFDYIKLENSLKEKLGKEKTRELSAERYSGEILETITRMAGGRIVLVKEAVLLTEDITDITDTVLVKLGLPIDVPGLEEIPYISKTEVLSDVDLDAVVNDIKNRSLSADLLITDNEAKKLEKKNVTIEDFFNRSNSGANQSAK